MCEEKIWNALLGLTDGNACGAAGLMGNLYAESALNPKNLQQSFEKNLGMTDDSYTEAVDSGAYANFVRDGAGYGLAQWTYWSRKEALLGWARNAKASIGGLVMQLDFLSWEFRTNYSGVLDALRSAKSVRAASDAVLLHYERPKDQSEAVRVRRAAYGQRYYDIYVREGIEDMQSYDKYIYSTGTHYISNSGQDENKSYHGGKAGDQTGKDWQLKAWYNRPWSVVLRYPDIAVGLKIADHGCAAALNDKIGYDQWQRTTYWAQLQKAGYDPSKITVACEEDCTAGVTANVKAVGYLMSIKALQNLPTDTYSGNMRSRFVAAGFKALTASKYLTSPNYLLPGDILLYEGHHAATNITYGKDVRPIQTDTAPIEQPKGLHKGDEGSAVTKLQIMLLKWNPKCLPKYGIDGDFGSETEKAVKAFQAELCVPVTGVYDEATRKALAEVTESSKKQVVVTGDSVNVRTAPNTTTGKILGVVHEGYRLPYQGQDSDAGWHLVEYDGQNAWISGKYSKVE